MWSGGHGNGRGTTEQWIKEGKRAIRWTPLDSQLQSHEDLLEAYDQATVKNLRERLEDGLKIEQPDDEAGPLIRSIAVVAGVPIPKEPEEQASEESVDSPESGESTAGEADQK